MKHPIIMNTPNNDIIPQGYKMTELGVLPEEWEVVMLGEVADISSGGNAPQGDKYFNGDKPFVRVSHIDNQNYSVNKYDLINDNAINDYRLKLFPKDTIIFPKSGATVYLEKRAMLPIDAYVVSHLCTVISNKEEAIQHFLFYVLISLKLAKEKADGYPTLNISEVKQILIPLPPLAEQQKIATVLSALQEAKEKTQEVIDATKALKKSMMKHLFTYGPVSLKEAENVPLKETEIGLMPEDWKVLKLGEVFNVQQGKQLSGKELKEGKTKKPFLRTSNLNWGNINISSIDEMCFTSEEFEKLKLKNGDILVCEGGDIGRTALYRGELTECAYQNHIHRLRPKKDNSNVEYFVFWMYYAINQRQMYTYTANRTTIPNLSSSRLKEFIFPLPPLPVQQKIASILSAIDEKIEAEENKKKALEELFKSLLHNLMTAKIRINQLELSS